jgi:hypothetical protein
MVKNEVRMEIITIERPTNSGTRPLSDFIRVLPPIYKENQLFRIEGTNRFIQPYAGKNKQIGIRLYRPSMFEGHHTGYYSVTILRPSGAIADGGLVELTFNDERL